MLTNQELSAAGLILPWHTFTECLSCIEVSIPYSLGKSRTKLGTQKKTVSLLLIFGTDFGTKIVIFRPYPKLDQNRCFYS